MNIKALMIGITVASIIFLIKEHKSIKRFILAILNRNDNEELANELNNLKKNKGFSDSEARDRIITSEIIKALKIDTPYWEVNRNLTLVQGDKVSFVDEQVGFIQGDFLGIIKPELVGYDDLYVIRNSKTALLRQASISYVKEDTINVYK